MKQNLVHPAALQLAVEASASERLQVLAAVYQAYQHRMQEARLVDFRDLISGTIELLQSRPALRDGMRAKFQLILVDEFQDVDPAQFELLRLIAPPESAPRLVVVGDPDQSIYGFRGTVPRLLSHDFANTYRAATSQLDECRRCSQDAFESALASSLGGVGARTVSRLRAHAYERARPLLRVVRRLMYVLAARDPQRYPLPWGGEPPSEEPSQPDYLPYLTEAELQNLHAAMVTREHLLKRAATLPLASLAYSVLIEDGAMRRLLDLDV